MLEGGVGRAGWVDPVGVVPSLSAPVPLAHVSVHCEHPTVGVRFLLEAEFHEVLFQRARHQIEQLRDCPVATGSRRFWHCSAVGPQSRSAGVGVSPRVPRRVPDRAEHAALPRAQLVLPPGRFDEQAVVVS